MGEESSKAMRTGIKDSALADLEKRVERLEKAIALVSKARKKRWAKPKKLAS